MAPPNHQPPRTQTLTQSQTQIPPPLHKRINVVGCIIIALLISALLVALAFFITWLTLKPKRLVYTVEAASLQDFSLTNSDHLNAKFDYVIVSRNPEKHVTVRYHSMRVSTAHHNQSVAHQEISPFRQPPKNETRIETLLVSKSVALSKYNAKDLRAEKSKGVIEMDVHITARVSYKVGIFRSRRRTLKAVCSPVMLNVTSNSLDGFERTDCVTRL
ncbi:PREDICTED: uncharacterized protein At1g08160-like [Tarenaya hassleriana]|uniref:uncharacterized protein At1g08160-like n=1 Tax=Tarenaya hassleriana TaxID=28532 RepID=UPI00053C6A1E|nr:PREDICTED: uncharacterized protein At1g08160-like [Tarenaya hassleriana]